MFVCLTAANLQHETKSSCSDRRCGLHRSAVTFKRNKTSLCIYSFSIKILVSFEDSVGSLWVRPTSNSYSVAQKHVNFWRKPNLLRLLLRTFKTAIQLVNRDLKMGERERKKKSERETERHWTLFFPGLTNHSNSIILTFHFSRHEGGQALLLLWKKEILYVE